MRFIRAPDLVAQTAGRSKLFSSNVSPQKAQNRPSSAQQIEAELELLKKCTDEEYGDIVDRALVEDNKTLEMVRRTLDRQHLLGILER